MSHGKKLIFTICSMVLVLSVGCFGVFAAASNTSTVMASMYYTADVVCQIQLVSIKQGSSSMFTEGTSTATVSKDITANRLTTTGSITIPGVQFTTAGTSGARVYTFKSINQGVDTCFYRCNVYSGTYGTTALASCINYTVDFVHTTSSGTAGTLDSFTSAALAQDAYVQTTVSLSMTNAGWSVSSVPFRVVISMSKS